ncbi:MAG TPA: GspE/PulE family protein [Patescibacteria group bacterium]|nr:GspE/PulE family protein [Patescibacteria group bacterium]
MDDTHNASSQTSQDSIVQNSTLAKLFLVENPDTTKFVQEVLQEVIRMGASDLLFEPVTNEYFRVRTRIDGELYELGRSRIESYPGISSRIKVLSGLDPTNKSRIQEGQYTVQLTDRSVNLRVEVAQTIKGELIVIRIHERGTIVMQLSALGFSSVSYQNYTRMLSSRSGLLLVSGPTGCGKTTTLYSTISKLSSDKNLNIMTIENPVEFQLDGVNQMQTKDDQGFTFAHGVRTILRLTPDVVLIGEIRDRETAEIAIQSGLTGQLVLSTVHADDSIGALFRLLDLGIETYFINSALIGVVAQRLVRKICQNCKESYEPNTEEKELFIKVMGRPPKVFVKAVGCPSCNYLRYKGRVGIFEVLAIDSGIRESIRMKENEDTIRKKVNQRGLVTLLRDGLEKAEQGVTTFDEVIRNSLRAF